MNEPRVPLSSKNWNDIDIFLFSNGQEGSPPRKYHLKSDELEFWESIIHYLARTQFGLMNSSIELYTLDGKKVESPLELVDAASYVAVQPPEAFIPAGYERYLIKASRSWEKRQEKLTNSDPTGEIQLIKEVSKSSVDEFKINETANIHNLKNITEMNDTNHTIISQQRKENERSFEGKQKEYKPFLNRKSVENKIIKKNTSQTSNNNIKADPILNKKRNTKSSFSRKQSVIPKRDKNNNKTNIFNKEKLQPNITKISEELDIKEIIFMSKPNQFDGNLSHEVSEMGSVRRISSDVYKNPDSEVQSIYIEVDRKTIPREYLTKEKLKCHELQKIDELNDELMTSQKVHKATSVQSITFSTKNNVPEVTLSSRAKELNIKLNIKVRDDRESTGTERSGCLGRCKSYTALLTAEQGSQADITMNLKDEDFKDENSSLRRKSSFGEKAYICSDLNDAKVIVVNCTCGLSEAYNINNNSKENYIILVPSTLADKNLESFRIIPDHNHTADKDCLTSRHSILNPETWHLKSNPVSKENSQTTIKHKVSICPDTPIKISADTPPNLKKQIINVIYNKKVDQFTQTVWCNMLLQARLQADGSSSFHLPPLPLLAQYNLL